MPLVAAPIQLFDSDVNLGAGFVANLGSWNPKDSSVDAAEAALADEQGSAEASGGRFEVGEGEDPQIISSAVAEELEEGDRVGEVPGVRVELGAPRAVDAAGGDAQRAGPRHLRRPRNDAVAVVIVRPPLAVGEVEALHICDGEEEKRIAEREM